MSLTRAACEALDAADPLSRHRAEFALPEGTIYLDGNSLGPLPRRTPEILAEVIAVQWGRDLITSWNRHGWLDLPRRVGDKIGALIGATPGTTVAADSTSVNLFKALSGALALRPGRTTIVSERDNFPTDLYIAEGLIAQLGGRHRLRLVEPGQSPEALLDDDTAVLMLTHVNYRTGAMHDLAGLTQKAHAAGALAIWDLAHSAGAVPVDLTGADADFAVGCGYKYLNGGPGAPAFLWVSPRHTEVFLQPLSGWMGHAEPFRFESSYRPALDSARALCGTPAILAMSALEVGVETVAAAGMAALREKSLVLTELFARRVAELCPELERITPPEDARRGSQICLRHPHAYAIVQALIAEGVIGDFRMPDVLRFGFAPLYVRHVDAFDAATQLARIVDSGAYDRPEFHARQRVT